MNKRIAIGVISLLILLVFIQSALLDHTKSSPLGDSTKTQTAGSSTPVDSENNRDSLPPGVEEFYGEVRFLTGKINYSEHPKHFVLVAKEYSVKQLYMHKEAYAAFKSMYAAALKDSVRLTILSACRNFETQKGIWERKWDSRKSKDNLSKAKNILEFSSMPMSSRHHWGTDVDLCSLDNEYFKSGKGKREYAWLVKNAAKYKFCQVYTENENDKLCTTEEKGKNHKRLGYRLEKWHWSYMPVSSRLYESYKKLVTNDMIKGFKGSELAKELKIKENYVGGISDTCKCVD